MNQPARSASQSSPNIRQLCRPASRPAFRLACLALCVFLSLASALLSPALAEPIHVSAASDAGIDPVQARQQAKERAFVEAVFLTAQRLLPAALPAPRAELLRGYLTPRATALVQSFQEAVPAKPAGPAADKPAPEKATPAKSSAPAAPDKVLAAPLTVEMDVEVNRSAIREQLLHLGLLAGPKHPKTFSLRFGKGVGEGDVKPLADVLALQGLARAAQAPVQVTLERVPQGYLKAVLWAGATSYAADSQDMTKLWLDIWGKFFSAREQQPGGVGSPIEVTGFGQVDAVLEFTKTLQGWDDCVREVQLHAIDVAAGNSTGRWTVRLTNPQRLDARLKEYLPGRKLTAVH